jgi:hypothetical protein
MNLCSLVYQHVIKRYPHITIFNKKPGSDIVVRNYPFQYEKQDFHNDRIIYNLVLLKIIDNIQVPNSLFIEIDNEDAPVMDINIYMVDLDMSD